MVFAWLIVFFCSIGVSAQDSDENRDLLQMLKGYEWELNQDMIDRFTESAAPAQIQNLIEIALDENLPVYIRPRAIAVLTRFPDDAVWDFFLQELQQAEGINRRRMADAICSGFIEPRPDPVIDALGPYLSSDDAHLRILVAECLQQTDSESAGKLIADYKTRVADFAEQWEKDALD